MDFDYAEAFGKSSANGYERPLLDAMLGDSTLFAHRDWQLRLPGLSITPGPRSSGRRNPRRRIFPTHPRRKLGPEGGGRPDGAGTIAVGAM